MTFAANVLYNVLSSASPIAGFLDDYAFVVCGLLDLFEATQRVRWLQWAEELQLRQDQLFWDSQGSGYFCSDPSDPTLLLALKQGEEQKCDIMCKSSLYSRCGKPMDLGFLLWECVGGYTSWKE